MKFKTLVIIISFLLFFILYNLFPFFLDSINYSKIMNDDQLENVYNKNENRFNNAKKVLINYPYIYRIEKPGWGKSDSDDDIFEYKTKNKLLIKSRKKLSKKVLETLDNKDILYIIYDLKFDGIYSIDDSVGFIQGASLGTAKGQVFITTSKDKYVEENRYYKIKEIKSGFYIFEEIS